MDHDTGETATIIRPGYRIDYLRPCGEEGKMVAEGNLAAPAKLDVMKAAFEKVFESVAYFPKLGMLKINHKGLSILLYEDGRFAVRKVKELGEAVAAAELLAALLVQRE